MKTLLLALALISHAAFAGEAPTFAEWKKLSNADKIDYIGNNFNQVELIITKKGFLYPKDDKTPFPLKKLIAEYYPKVLKAPSELYTDVEDDFHATIGDPTYTLEIFFSKDKKIIGSNMNVSQQGCSHEDEGGGFEEQSGHYETEAEANRNRCFDNDVSWRNNSYRDENGLEMDTNGYMEWTGH